MSTAYVTRSIIGRYQVRCPDHGLFASVHSLGMATKLQREHDEQQHPKPAPEVNEAALQGIVDYLAEDSTMTLQPVCEVCGYVPTSDGRLLLVEPCPAHTERPRHV